MMLLEATAGAPLQSALDAFGSQSARIERLWWVFFWICAVVYGLVLITLVIALVRRGREGQTVEGNGAAKRVVTIASAATAATLFFLLISTVAASRDIATDVEPFRTIELVGHQWWWQADYDNPDTSKRFSTANELYVPVGKPVRVKLRTSDVIHSFWVPNLAGKRDLITGHDSSITIQADRAGTFRGQCAEFCGVQHAKMAFWVTALPPAQYEQWEERQRQPSDIPATPEERQGQDAFMNSPCPLCHTIAGTDASGKTAPDLTHFASRRSIAAGTLPNRRDELAEWITDPQHVKPGNNMPPMILKTSELNSLLTYLESLE